MRFIQIVISVFLLFFLVLSLQAQTNWLLAERIEKTNAWNKPFYKPYNNVNMLFSNRTDSAIFCFDCNLSSVICKGIEASKIPVYMPDKKKVLVLQKNIIVKKSIEVIATKNNSSFNELMQGAECTVYRKSGTDNITSIKDLSIEWLSIEVKQNDATFIFYVRAKECLEYLDIYACTWIHPANHSIQISYKQALVNRQYFEGKKTMVSASTLQEISDKNVLPSTLQSLANKDSGADFFAAANAGTVQMHLQAMCSGSILSPLNRGYNKVHVPEILIRMYEEKKIQAYTYHEAGYFTTLAVNELTDHLLIETGNEDDYTVTRFGISSLTTLHILKKFTQLDNTSRISNEWLILGVDSSVSTAFTNTYVIAFLYQEVLNALAGTSYMWYSGTNQLDSVKLDEALRSQRFAYDNMLVSTMYNDTVVFCTNADGYREYKSPGTFAAQLYTYTESLRADFSASRNRLQAPGKQTTKHAEMYRLNYFFDTNSQSAFTKNTALTDLLLDAIRTKKIKTYDDDQLSKSVSQDLVLSKLDKARFYKTGNKRKDSIYISKIPMEERYIKSSELTQYTINATYTMHSKSVAQAKVIGIYIPAVLNPQYEAEVFCYVSYPEFLTFLQKNKTGKKYVSELTGLLNEHAIISVEDFYEITIYDVADEKRIVSGILPPYVRERVVE